MIKLKKLIAAFLSVTMCFTLASESASAAVTGELTGPIYDMLDTSPITTRGANRPTQFYNLGGNNRYTATFYDLSADRGVYTNYYFATGTGSIYVKMSLERAGTTQQTDRKLTIHLYQKNTALEVGREIDSRTVSFSTASTTRWAIFNNLDPNKFYFILFENVSSNSYLSNKAISCQAIVDDYQPS